MDVRVWTDTGSGADARPTKLALDGWEIQVTELRDRWRGLNHDYFRVRGANGRCYLLAHDRRDGAWLLLSVVERIERREDALEACPGPNTG